VTAVMGIEPNVLGRIQRLAFRRSGERHRRAQARSASMHRWGRLEQRKKTQPSTSNIGEAGRRCSRCDYAQRGAPRTSGIRIATPRNQPRSVRPVRATVISGIAWMCASEACYGATDSWTNTWAEFCFSPTPACALSRHAAHPLRIMFNYSYARSDEPNNGASDASVFATPGGLLVVGAQVVWKTAVRQIPPMSNNSAPKSAR